MRLREFKTPKPILMEAAPAAIVAAWPWLVGLFGAAGATVALQQNPQAVEDFSEWAVDSLPDARALEPEDRNLIMSPYGSMINGLGQAWDYITSSDKPTQAEIDKRVDNALAAGAQRRGGERTQEIISKYQGQDISTSDPKLQAQIDANRAEDDALIAKIIDTPTQVTPQSKAQADDTLSKLITQRTTPSAKADTSDAPDIITKRTKPKPAAADPSDDAIANKMVTQPNQPVDRVKPVPIGQSGARATPGGMADRKGGRTVAPDATAPLTSPSDIPSTAPGVGVKPGEAPSAKGRDVVPPADAVKPGAQAKPDAGAIAKPEAGAIAKPEAGTVAEPITRADPAVIPGTAAPAVPAPAAPVPPAAAPPAKIKPGTAKPQAGGNIYTGRGPAKGKYDFSFKGKKL